MSDQAPHLQQATGPAQRGLEEIAQEHALLNDAADRVAGSLEALPMQGHAGGRRMAMVARLPLLD